jgi:N-methylhydantoinase A/oxoprolinase/acetone carboxylase beta subunit/N-methylhydantoinase B/oxoprolinase/acetone carboxylase alpha subunit
LRVAIDTGGTFTDCVYMQNGTLQILKVLSRPHNPAEAVLNGLSLIGGERMDVRHGTTVGTNAMLERKGARVAFVTTAGFEDTIAIGRQTRAHLYDWFAPIPECIVARELRFGVPERVSAEGTILRAPTNQELEALAEAVKRSGAEAIAISLLFSFANPANEQRVAAALAHLELSVSVSHRILPEFREYERASTTVVNAYLAPRMERYLLGLADRVHAEHNGNVEVMQSSGGITSARIAAHEPVRTVLSGPAGGVIGACRMAQLAGVEKIIGVDMGGTSTDVFLADVSRGGAALTHESIVAGVPVGVPMLDIHTAGAGGGSIARFDAGGLLRVGPESVGSDPGPICYGRGNQVTVTDANLLLGRLDEGSFLDGKVKLDRARAHTALDAARGSLPTVEEYASGILRVVETEMQKAIQVISVERGHDPRDFTLVAFGGGGPLHACTLARALRIPRVLIPRLPGALSAVGILLADTVRDYSRTVMLRDNANQQLARVISELEIEAEAEFASGVLAGNGSIWSVEKSLDIRYRGQGYELNIPLDGKGLAAALEEFHALHQQRYGFCDPQRGVEIVNVRLRARIVGESFVPKKVASIEGKGEAAVTGERQVYFDGQWQTAKIYDREKLIPGDKVSGPGLITEYSSVTVLPPGASASMDGWGNLVVEVGRAEDSLLKPSVPDTKREELDTVELAIFSSAVHSIAEEMGAALRRTAVSPNIKERRDYSCAIFDARGQVIAMGDHMPVHLGSMPMSVHAAVEKIAFEPGDIAILNDPFAGGTHLPDITMVLPVFLKDGDSGPSFYVSARAHHADVGGSFAGSMGPASEVFQEGIRIPPVRIVRQGRIDREMLDLVLWNVRTPHEREGDLAAQIGACRVGEQRVRELAEKYSAERAQQWAAALLDYSERLVRAELSQMPAGEFTAEDWLDDDGITDAPPRLAAVLRPDPKNGSLTIDLRECCDQVQGSVNAVRSITLSACFYVLRCLLGEQAPATAGILRPLMLLTRQGSIVDALPPAAVAGGNVETSQRIVDVVMRALAQAAPGRVPAAAAGTMSNLTIGGKDPRTGTTFTYYETTAGGMGARPGMDGLSGVQTHMTNSLNTPVEALEYAYPFRVRRYGLRTGSGGRGKYRGGDGLIRELELLADAQVTLLAERRKFRPYGLQGGGDGAAGLATLRLPDGVDERALPGKCSARVPAGAVLRLETPGGGGWGE